MFLSFPPKEENKATKTQVGEVTDCERKREKTLGKEKIIKGQETEERR